MSGIGGKTIFFAEVSRGMRMYKDNLVKELEHAGCIIKEASSEGLVDDNTSELVAQCEIAIHLLSDTDQIIDSLGKGLEETQIQISVQHYLSQKLMSSTSDTGFVVYAWHLKSSTESIYNEERVPSHIMNIQQLEEVDFLRSNFEDFKYYLLKKIEEDNLEVEDRFYIKGSDNLSIYFLFDAIDKEGAEQYIDYLEKRGFTVFSPLFESDIMAARQMHTSCLKKFDIAIIFAKDANINWVNMKIMDILKSPGLGREKRILGKAVIAPEQNLKLLNLRGRGFDYFPVDINSPQDQIEDFLKGIDY